MANDIEIPSDSDRENSDEENSDEENSNIYIYIYIYIKMVNKYYQKI